MQVFILIESQWNLNSPGQENVPSPEQILIESQWNLNNIAAITLAIPLFILIESQWNLNNLGVSVQWEFFEY